MAGKHGSRSNYADKPVSEDSNGVLHQHRLTFDHMSSSYIPTASERDTNGAYSSIPAEAAGDWSWKPARDKALGYDDDSQFKTFLGVPKGMPEQLGRAREEAGEPGAVRHGNPILPIRKYPRVIPGAHGGSFDTLAGTHIGQ